MVARAETVSCATLFRVLALPQNLNDLSRCCARINTCHVRRIYILIFNARP
jgi:hypothetical protein